MKEKTRKHTMLKNIRIWHIRQISLLGICLLVLMVGINGAGIKRSVSRQPEQFTELYFVNYASLPRQNMRAGQTYGFNIAIVNHEKNDLRYSYQLEMIENGSVTRQAFTTEVSSVGESLTKYVSFTPQHDSGSLKVTVRLIDQQQEIHYEART